MATYGTPHGRPGGMPPELRISDEELKRLRNRDRDENKLATRWLIQTGLPYLPGIFILMIFSVINSLASIAFALLSQGTVNSAVDGHMSKLVIFAIALVCCTIAQIFIRAVSNYCTEMVSARVENGYRSRVFNYILDRDFQQLSTYHSGELMNRMTDDVNIIVSGVTSFLPSIAEIIANLIGAGTVLLVMDWRFLLVYLAATAVLVVVTKVFRKSIKMLSAKVREADGKTRSFFQDSIASLLVLRVFVTEDSARQRSEGLLNDFYATRLKRSRVRILSNSIMGLSMNFGHVFAIIWCSFCLVGGTMTYGALVAIMQLTGQVRMPFISASNLMSQYYSMIASAERLMELEKLDPELTDEERRLLPDGYDAQELYGKLEALNVEDVSFSYGDEEILRDVTLHVNKGESIAVMGQSGCGKSTLFKLMLGVLKKQGGILEAELEDGSAIHLGPQTRRLFAYVPQGNLLVSGRLRDNIAFAFPNASEKDIWEACRVACIDNVIKGLPHGLDTIIGEHGSGLSEGQVQRVAIARAYLSGAPILLLDEATSALDEQTEASVLNNLKELGDRTCVIVTHRRAALEICDSTYVMPGR